MKLSVIWPVHGLRVDDVLRVSTGELLRVHGVADSHAMVERDHQFTRGDGARLVGVMCLVVASNEVTSRSLSVIPMRELQLWTLTDEAAA